MTRPVAAVGLEELVRFSHPRKILAGTRLPGLEALDDERVAALYGTTVERQRTLADRLRAEARETALTLAGHPGLAPESLPDGARLLAVGDSITDDIGSWAEMIAAALVAMRPRADVAVVNAGLSGDTTADVIARNVSLPPADLAIVLLGTNDARRHGRDGVPVLVTDGETLRNVALLDELLRRRCGKVLWVTPPPVLEKRVEADAGLRAADLRWRAADLRRKAAIVRAGVRTVADVWPAFGDPPAAHLLRADGVHPSSAGQLAIASTVLDAIAQSR